MDAELTVECVKCGKDASELIEWCGGVVVFAAGHCDHCGHDWSCDNAAYLGSKECSIDDVRNNRAPKQVQMESCVSCSRHHQVDMMDDYEGIGHLCKFCQRPDNLEKYMTRLREKVRDGLVAADESRKKHDVVCVLRDSLMIKVVA